MFCVKIATYVGKVGEFDPSKETFKSYCDRMDMFFEANDLVVLGGAANAVADAAVVRKKKVIFLTEIGADSFTLVNNLLAPRSAKEVGLNEITCVLNEHYNPTQLEIAESLHFGTRVQKEGKSIAYFTMALKKLSIHLVLISFAVGSRRKRSFQWNMGLMNADSKFEQNVCNRDFNINVQKMLLKN